MHFIVYVNHLIQDQLVKRALLQVIAIPIHRFVVMVQFVLLLSLDIDVFVRLAILDNIVKQDYLHVVQ
jgi:hypothetical protein